MFSIIKLLCSCMCFVLIPWVTAAGAERWYPRLTASGGDVVHDGADLKCARPDWSVFANTSGSLLGARSY